MSLAAMLKAAAPAVLVRVAETKGSAPREAGTVMAVTTDAIFGTIGGGQFEWLAIDHARGLLAGKRDESELDIPLGSDIGQCCGGRVRLRFEPVTEAVVAALETDERAAQDAWPHVHIFGAGHVGRALAMALTPLPVTPIVYDARASELALLPDDIESKESALPEAEVRAARPGSAFVVLTHDHALDFLIAREALARRDAAYIGLIGSKTKRATFRNWFKREGGEPEDFKQLVCPIGSADVKDKRPEVIAALAAAEIITALNRNANVPGETHERTSSTP